MSRRQGSILHLIDTTGPGGAETIFTQLAAYTQNLGCKCIAVIRGPGWVEQELARLGVETRIIDCKGSFNTHFLRSLREIIRTEQIDLIQAHLLGSSLYASMAGLLTSTPVISTFHGHVDVSPSERFRLAKFLIIQLGSDHIVAVTQQLRIMLSQVPTVSSRKVRTIPNGIDTSIYSPGKPAPFRDTYQIPEGAILMGCLGNVRKAKNYNLAIDTLKVLQTQGVDAWLLIAGDDKNTLAESHRQHAHDLGVADKVIWLGFYTDTPAFLNALGILLLSSSSEGHPLAITQAMASGTPIVATQCGVEEILAHRETALLADKGNAEQLAEHVVTLSRNPHLKEKLVRTAQQLAQDTFSLTAMCDRYQALYSEFFPTEKGPAPQHSWITKRILSRYGSKRGLLASCRHNLFTRKYQKYGTLPNEVERVVFVCKGNICRSAAAEYAFRKHSQTPTTSIGLDTHTGKEGNPRIVRMAKATGIDMSPHRTTAAQDFEHHPGDLFVCMEPSHLAAVEKLYGTNRTVLLGYFGNPKKLYIHDPYSAADCYARDCTDYIVTSSEALAHHFKSTVQGPATCK